MALSGMGSFQILQFGGERKHAATGGIVTKQSLSKYEKGKSKPTPVVLNKMAEALRVQAAYLCTEPSVRINFIAYRKGSGLLKIEQAKVEGLARQSLEDRIRLQEIIGQTHGVDLHVESYPGFESESYCGFAISVTFSLQY